MRKLKSNHLTQNSQNVSVEGFAADLESSSPAKELPQKGELQVLIVEDSEDDALLIVDNLRKGGFNPHWQRVESAETMRQALSGGRWELILADHKLPSFTALEAFSIYRESGLDFPFIIVSGKIGEEAAVSAMKAGVHDLIDKSRLSRLPLAVKRELAEADIRREKERIESQLRAAYSELRLQRDALALQVHLINLSHDAIITTGPNGAITGWNAGATEMYGLTEAEAVGRINPSVLAIASSPAPNVNEALHKDGRWDGELAHKRRDGHTLIIDSRQVLLRDANGAPMGKLEVNRDISERKQAEEELKRSLNDKVALLQEVHHRVKNNLQVIASLLAMQASCVENAETTAKLQISERRVMSMAMIHESLYSNESMSSLDFAEYGADLVAQLFAFYPQGESVTYNIQAASTTLPIEQAVPCGLILNELVTNALKYAYPDGKGEILIRLSSHDDHVCLSVSDQGVGLPLDFNASESKSLGMKLVRALTEQLDGNLEVGPSPGASFTVRFPKLP